MTNPADVDVNAHLGGVDPTTGGVLAYQAVPVLARTIYSNYDGRQPYYTNYGKGNVANSAATYDAVTGGALQTSTRHIDPYGNAAELHKVWMLLWYWLMDGAPTNMGAIGAATNRIPLYIRLANQLRPWPVGYAGAAAGEPTQAYPAFPSSVPTPLDSFVAQTSTRDAAKAHASFHGVPPVVHHHKPKGFDASKINQSIGGLFDAPFIAPQQPVGQFMSGQIGETRREFAPGGLVGQFTSQAGPEHYAAAGIPLNPIPPEYRLPPADGTEKTAPESEGVLEQILSTLGSIQKRLDRAGL